VDQIITFVSDNLLLFGALVVVLVMLIKAELDHQLTKGQQISVASAIRLMNNNEDALIIDTRSSSEFKTGHIKGARNVPLAEFAKKLDSFSSHKSKPVLVYCNSGNTSMQAIKQLKTAGFEQINNLNGGIQAWKEANLPLSKK
jgi:rhodanese-related sulfurtransferase